MPALKNPRHEHFAQLIFEGLTNGETKPYSQSRAYIAAGYSARDTGRNHRSAQASSSRLLSRVIHRVRELQAEAAEQTAETAEKCVAELNQLKRDAHAKEAYAAAISAVMGKAKILGFDGQQQQQQSSFTECRSMHEIGRKLLQSCGFNEPDDDSIEAALELNRTFIAGLERIAAQAQGLVLEQDD